MKKIAFLALSIVLAMFCTISVFAQDIRLASDEPQIRAIALGLMQSENQRKPAETGQMILGGNMEQIIPTCRASYYGVFSGPILKVNRRSFRQGQTLQAWLQLPNYPTHIGDAPCEVKYSWYMTSVDSQPENIKTGVVDGTRILKPREIVQLVNYTWPSELAEGQYFLIYFCQDAKTGGLISMATTVITYGDNWKMNYIGIDSAEFIPGTGKILLRGRFIPIIKTPFGSASPLEQYVEINGLLFVLENTTDNTAEFEWTESLRPRPNIYDLTLVVWNRANKTFDSNSAPGVLVVR